MKIEFKHIGGPFGDATSNYQVVIPEGTTVREFIKYIVTDYSVKHDEWGDFSVGRINTYPKCLLHYNRGSAFFELPWCNEDECKPILAEIADEKIVRVTANGGWSNMGYTLYLEEKGEKL